MRKIIVKNKKAMPAGPLRQPRQVWAGRIEASRQGFSLLELMIAIAIAGIMTAVMMVSMNAQKDKKAVEAAAREVAAVIREIQNYALTGKNLASLPGCSYAFNWVKDSSSYNIAGCDTRSYSLKDGVKFNNISNGGFSFSATFANLNTSATVSIDLLKNGNHYYVCVYKSGVISESLVACP